MQEILAEFGLSKNEISIYSALVEHGPLTAKKIASLSRVPRVRTYQLLDRLCTEELVSKKEGTKIIHFQAIHPDLLNAYIAKRVLKMEKSKYAFESVLPLIISQYNRGLRRPSIVFYEGVEGFKKIYDDILAEGQPIYIIASSIKRPEYQKIIQDNKKKQEKAGIVRHAIVSRDNSVAGSADAATIKGKKAGANTGTVKKILRDDLELPGQILIYGNKVAITDFSGSVSHFVIEHKSISELFRRMFSFMGTNYNKKLM